MLNRLSQKSWTLRSRSLLAASQPNRAYGNMTKECSDHLKQLGITNKNVVFNPSVAELYEYAMLPEHMHSPDPTVGPNSITETGALCISSGSKKGRVPKQKRIVDDDLTRDTINWGDINIKCTAASYNANKKRAVDFMNLRERIFVIDGYAGWDEDYRIKTRVISNRPYHALFMKQMLIRNDLSTIKKDFTAGGPDFTILNSGEFVADDEIEDIGNKTSVNVNFSTKELVILGTSYAGEMKKGVFGIMHYYMPKRGALSMHCAANIGPEGDTTILFGLSGTGKTTLSSDPKRLLIGDDEHVWTDKNVFNIEGGCYAKADGLSRTKEPDIFDAVKFGAIVENTRYYDTEGDQRIINYDDISLTPNTRVCYPLEHIRNVQIPAIGGHPKNIIFLTCDAFGVMPPVSRLDPEQAMYHFISGYTSKVAGTEVGVTEPQMTFSACFGEAFLPLHPYVYAEMLAEKCEKHKAKVWLINTGWVRGGHGVGHRMSLTQTRAIIDSIHDDSLDMSNFHIMRRFNLKVPSECSGVDPEILRPINCWPDKDSYKTAAKSLAEKFVANFERYESGVPENVTKIGGPNMDF